MAPDPALTSKLSDMSMVATGEFDIHHDRCIRGTERIADMVASVPLLHIPHFFHRGYNLTDQFGHFHFGWSRVRKAGAFRKCICNRLP